MEYAVKDFTIHEKYDPIEEIDIGNDICILRLKLSVPGNRSLALPRPGQPLQPGTPCTILGWGYMDNKRVLSDTLQKVGWP